MYHKKDCVLGSWLISKAWISKLYRNNFGAHQTNTEVRSLNENSSYFLTISSYATVNTDKLGSQFQEAVTFHSLKSLKDDDDNLYSLMGI